MKVTNNVKSTVQPNQLEFDELHVYVNKGIHQIPESERESEIAQLEKGQTLTPMYEYSVEEYDKDEFLGALQTGQVSLDVRATSIEDMILEISEAVYA